MIPKIQYNLTNWVDGMKVGRQHFVDSENAFIDQIRDSNAVFVRNFNYGLLEPLMGEKSSLACDVMNNQSNQFKIVVSQCRAITMGGNRIEIIQGIHAELTNENSLANFDTKAKAFYAIISIDPFKRVPFGMALTDESPARNQSTISEYKLHFVDEESIDAGSLGPNHLPVARFEVKQNELAKDANYIPPCATLAAHPGSRLLNNTIANYFEVIQQCSIEIVQKVENNKDRQQTPLAKNIADLCKRMVYQISSNYFLFRTVNNSYSPVFLADSVFKLANEVNIFLNLLSIKEKEDILNYFRTWNDISPGAFQEMLTGIINADYQHENINSFFNPTLNFLKGWAKVLEELKNLQLIGERRKDGDDIFTVREEKPKKTSFFD